MKLMIVRLLPVRRTLPTAVAAALLALGAIVAAVWLLKAAPRATDAGGMTQLPVTARAAGASATATMLPSQ